MKKEIKRYKQGDYYYADHYIVECPNCGKSAEIKPGRCGTYRTSEGAIIQCNHCTYKKEYSDFIQYKAFADLYCPSCGKEIHYSQGQFNSKPEQVKIKCPECELMLQVKPRIEKYTTITQKQSGTKYDPIFGFPLWFQEEIRGNLFWGYNRKHLIEIYQYVDSHLRERQYKYGMTMVERLPSFIKEAKNREEIIKTINHLLKK